MISELKIHPVETVKTGDSIVDVAKKLRDKKIRHVYVVDEGEKPAGVISAIDISGKVVAEGKDTKGITAKDVMNTPVESADVKQEVEFAMRTMLKYKTYSCLVTENGKIKGVVDYKSVLERIVKKVKEDEKNGA